MPGFHRRARKRYPPITCLLKEVARARSRAFWVFSFVVGRRARFARLLGEISVPMPAFYSLAF